jgi:hypothetical protein
MMWTIISNKSQKKLAKDIFYSIVFFSLEGPTIRKKKVPRVAWKILDTIDSRIVFFPIDAIISRREV